MLFSLIILLAPSSYILVIKLGNLISNDQINFTYCAIRDFNKEHSNYIICGTDVLDITEFIKLNFHPGGFETLRKATMGENQAYNIKMHRAGTINKINKFKIGKVKVCESKCAYCLEKINLK